MPVRLPGGMLMAVSTAPLMAVANIGGPAAAMWVAFVGTTEWREVRGRIPWYGTLANHAVIALPAALGGVVVWTARSINTELWFDFAATAVGCFVMLLTNAVLV